MLVTIVRLSLFLFTCSALLACRGDSSAPSEMWLEIPEMNGRVEGNGFTVLHALPSSGISTLRLHISAKQSGDISYGAIHTKINTEAADDVTTKRGTSDGVLCDLDLRHWGEGFNLRPGRNSVEAYFSDRYRRIHYASFLMEFGGQTAPTSRKPESASPVKISGEKYAVIIGISKYKYLGPKMQLQYARKDAEAFLTFLKSQRGGAFPDDADHLRVLLDEDATTQNLEGVLRTFLTKPKPTDLVVIYFAGHGEADSHDLRNLYLLTYDTKPDEYGSTAFPMEQLSDVFGRIIKAQNVISFVDSCNSFGISGARAKSAGGAGPTGQNDLTNQYLARYARANASFAIITASDVSESSYEGPQFGNGHGAFSYYLLKGLSGEARSNPRSDAVTAGDLFAYLSEQVPKATENERDGPQHPRSFPGLAENLLLSGTAAWQGARIERGETKAVLRP